MSKIFKVLNNRFRILKELGQGGFSVTYQAQDLISKELCVVKELSLDKAADWKAIELFKREAGVLSHLDHPNIPNYIDHFTLEEDNQSCLYLVQELIEGNHFEALIQNGKFFIESEVQEMGLALLSLLQYLHQFSPPMIHRDIKPSNVMLSVLDKIYLIDFGAAKGALHQVKTESGQPTVVGTFGYMPIEQFEGQALPASDIYSLGMTLIYILSHKHPTDMDKKGLLVNFRPHVNISEAFAQILDKMIQPDLNQRYASADEVISDLQKLRVGESPQEALVRQSSPKKKSGWVLSLIAALGVLGGLALSEMTAKPEVPAPESSVAALNQNELNQSASHLSESEALRLANQFYNISEFKSALPYYNRVIQLDPSNAQVYFRRGFCLGKVGSHKLAIADYEKAYELEPKSYPNSLYNIAWNYEQLGQEKTALTYYNRMLALRPRYADAYNNRGLVHDKMGNKELALKDFRKAIEVKPDYHYPYNNIGDIYLERGKYNEALAQYKLAVEKKPDYAVAHRNMGEVYRKYLKDHDKALKSFNTALRYDPRNATAYNWRGLLYHNQGNYDRAIQDFDKAIVYGKPYKQAVYNKALSYDDMGKLDAALTYYRKALDLDPNYSLPLNNMGLIYEKRKDYKNALAYYSKAVDADPSAMYFDNRGGIYKRQKQCAKALADFKKACQMGRSKACKKTCP